MMMPKMFLVLALLAHGAVSVRSGNWLSEGQLKLDKVDEDPVDEKLVGYMQGRLKNEFGIKASHPQVEEFLRAAHAKNPQTKRWEAKDWSKVPGWNFRMMAKPLLPEVGASALEMDSTE